MRTVMKDDALRSLGKFIRTNEGALEEAARFCSLGEEDAKRRSEVEAQVNDLETVMETQPNRTGLHQDKADSVIAGWLGKDG